MDNSLIRSMFHPLYICSINTCELVLPNETNWATCNLQRGWVLHPGEIMTWSYSPIPCRQRSFSWRIRTSRYTSRFSVPYSSIMQCLTKGCHGAVTLSASLSVCERIQPVTDRFLSQNHTNAKLWCFLFILACVLLKTRLIYRWYETIRRSIDCTVMSLWS